jgi:ATP-binding cassette subfamily C protein CydD
MKLLDLRLLGEAAAVRLALALTVLLGTLGGIAIVVQAWLLSRAIAQVFLGGQTLAGVRTWLLLFLAVACLRAGLTWSSELAAHRVADRVKDDLRRRLAAHLLALGPAYVQGERSGELAATLVEGVEALDAYFRQYLPQLALAALVPLSVLLIVFPLDWVSGIVLLLTAPLIPVFMVLIGRAAEALTRRQWTALGRMSAHFLDVLQGLATLKALGRSREQLRSIAAVSERYRRTTMGVLRVTFLSALALEMVATLSTAVVAVQVGLRLLGGHIAFEQALFVLVLAPEFYLPLRLLGVRFHAGMQGVAAARRIWEVLDVEPQAARRAAPVPPASLPASPLPLVFEDVHLAYDEGARPALKGLSLSVAPGETVALVGPSGAGKSTVAYLLLRFLEPDRGTITAGGRPLAALDPVAWRRQVAWVSQKPALFYGTVADNIRLARPTATPDEVIWAARQAHAHEFVSRLPQGYDTLLGERGARLSGGQAQRLALARAFLQDAPLLLLDEATANLDPEVEQSIQEALERLLRGRAALIIAHRLHTIYRADRILVLDGGRVVEEGSHDELLARGGLYRRLVTAYRAEVPA